MRRPLVALVSAVAVVASLVSAAPSAQAECDGSLCLTLSNIPGEPGKLAVTWSARDNFTGYTVIVSASRADGARIVERQSRGHAATDTQMRVVVDHAPGATQASGGYTFVRLVKHGRDGNDYPTRWQWKTPAPVAPPSGTDSVKVATFNIRTWGADSSQRAWNSWTHRRARVVRQMVNSGAGVFLLQEASGSPKLRVAGRRWQYQDLAARLPDRYVLARRATYTYQGRTAGAQGNRIIYDATRYSRRATGYFRMPVGKLRANRWVPWVLLRSKKTGAEFYAMSTHFKSGDDRRGSQVFYDARQIQVERIVADAQRLAAAGRTVFVGGDFNSTSNTLPGNNVHRAFADAGFYDGFATTERTNGQYPTTNGFRFPVPPQPYRRDYVMALHPTARGDVAPDAAYAGSFGFRNHIYQHRSAAASDHFMQSATMPVKPGPY